MDFITTKEAALKWGISPTRITILANEGRIPGAQRIGRSWLIPADAEKPAQRKARQVIPAEDSFSFPLYLFRPDWSSAKELGLSQQQRALLAAQKATMECRFAEAYSLLQPIIHSTDDIYCEIGALWAAGICCICLNRPKDFSSIFLRFQMLLAEDFPHREDCMVALDFLKTYVETIISSASKDSFRTDVHSTAIPMTCLQVGYTLMLKEAISPGSADTTLLELNLRFLESTSAATAAEYIHFYLLGIYMLRGNIAAAEKHGKAAVQIAFEKKLYFPLVTYYRFNSSFLSPIIAQYPKDFQAQCKVLVTQYDKNYSAFIKALNDTAIFAHLTDTEYSYLFAVLMDSSNAVIAQRLGVSQQTVKRHLDKLCEKIGVSTKKELKEYLRKYL